jgi:glycine cleavage system H protein
MNVPANLKYTNEHEWIRVEDDFAYVGITDYAQSELGEIVFIEVETLGEKLSAGDVFGTVEAVKTVSDLYLPIDGVILEFNEELIETPEVLNDDPYIDGWIIKVSINNPIQLNSLLSPTEYETLIGK